MTHCYRFAVIAAVAALLTPALASAQSDERNAVQRGNGVTVSEDGQHQAFDDDDLLGDPFGGHGFVLRTPMKPRRVLLIRPRASFVPEMLKSVEGL